MRLKLEQLQKVVKDTIQQEKLFEELQSELYRVLGPGILGESSLASLCRVANEEIDTLVAKGKFDSLCFKPSTMLKLVNCNEAPARRLAARTLPQRFLSKMLKDKSASVRSALAERVSLADLKQMLRSYPNDDQVKFIFENRQRLVESTLPAQTKSDDHASIYDDGVLSQARMPLAVEMSDLWYEDLANRFIADYGRVIEDSWEETAVNRFVSSTKATSGVQIDHERLLKAVQKALKDRDDRTLNRSLKKESPLRGVIANLRESARNELPIEKEKLDEVVQLDSMIGSKTFFEQAKDVFNVKFADIRLSSAYRHLDESMRLYITAPVHGVIPHAGGLRPVDERVLDRFCLEWEKQTKSSGLPMRLNWAVHPEQTNKVCFSYTLR